MELDRIVVDVEIEKEIGKDGLTWDDTDKVGVSVACVYSYRSDRFSVYLGDADELTDLQHRLLIADEIIGYNIWKFDLPVIFGLKGRERVWQLAKQTNDLLRRIWASAGNDPDVFDWRTHGGWSLDKVARGTLRQGKIGTGAHAPLLYKEGKIGQLITYCLDDVRLERNLCDFIDRYGYVVHQDGYTLEINTRAIPVRPKTI